MGIATTHMVTREFAMQVILSKLYSLTDEQVGDVMDKVVHNGFYNFVVVSQEEMEENKKKQWPDPYLDNIYQVPDYNDAH